MKPWIHKSLSILILCFIVLLPVKSESLKVVPDQEFTLGMGQQATLNDNELLITFKSVLEDSRCPINVVCVWAGNGKVALEVLVEGTQTKKLDLNTEMGAKEKSLKKYRVQLLSLNPAKIDGVSIAPEEYSINLQIIKN